MLKLGPEIGRNRMIERRKVLLHLLARDGTGNDRSDDRMTERELQGCRGQGHIVRSHTASKRATRSRISGLAGE